MKFNVTIDRDEDGIWIVECPSIPGCVSQGKTKEKALESIQDAIHQCRVALDVAAAASFDRHVFGRVAFHNLQHSIRDLLQKPNRLFL